MTEYEQIETTGHIKRINILGADPLTNNVVIELYCGRPQDELLHRVGAFSIAADTLRQLLHQAADELATAATTKTHNA